MKKCVVICFCLIFFSVFVHAQLPGIIVRPAGMAGPAVLDTNLNGFASKLSSGFAADDMANSELSYKLVAPVIAEPTGDLLRGPSGSYSDIVKTFDGSGFYLFSDGTNLLCRLRIGGIVSGSKGYSVLLDTDQKFGPSGSNADPNFQAATNGSNGNPGFEYEVVFETNVRIAVYNVDGTSTPLLVISYPLSTHSQVSVAATTDGGNPDFFYDFYVPFSAMGLTSASVIRATATTVMSPQPAIGGPKSDVYGLSGTSYMEDWNTIINQQPSFAIAQINNVGSGISAACTAAPIVNPGIMSATPNITGSWTNSTYSTNTKATIRVYSGSTLIGTIDSVMAGATWQIAAGSPAEGSVITAKAHAANETMCLTSNEVKVTNCTPATQTSTPTIDCGSTKGFEGTRPAGALITLYKLTSTGAVLIGGAGTTYPIIYSGTNWAYNGQFSGGTDGCSGGANDIGNGAYMAIATTPGGCASDPFYRCVGTGGTTATPSVTSLLVDGVNVITGTATAGTLVSLFIEGYYKQSVTAGSTGLFSFTLADKLSINQEVSIRAAANLQCASAAFTGTVSCYVAAPIITASSADRVTVGAQLTGTSSAAAGSTITVYNASTLAAVGTSTTVQSDGTWTHASIITAGTSYYAKVTGHTCGTSASSDTVTAVTGTASARCGTIDVPASDTVTSVTGTVSGSIAETVVILFADGDSVGTDTTSTMGWSIPVNTTVYNRIYSGAVLTISVTETGKTAINCPLANQVVPCVSPTTPSITPATTTVSVGQAVTYTVSAPQSGILYSIRDKTDANDEGASGFGSGASMTLASDTFVTPGNYTLRIKATSLSGSGCASSSSDANVTVMGALPLSLTTFNGMYDNGLVKLNWETVFEQDIEKFEIERSANPSDFKKIGEVTATGNSTLRNNYQFNDADGKSNILYYRLRIIDRSTTIDKYSKVIVLRSDKGIVINQVAPNPFSDVININMNAADKKLLEISLKDVGGRVIKVLNFTTSKGQNQIILKGLRRVAAGTYVLEVIAGGDKIYRELLIKR